MNTHDRPLTPGNGLPLASPLGTPNRGASTQARGAPGGLRGTNDPSVVTPVSARPRRVGARQLDRVGMQLAERDWQLLRLLDQHSYLTTLQLQSFLFTNHASPLSAARSCRRVLARLSRDGLLRSLPRRQGGVTGGSAPVTWQLSPAGVRLIRPERSGYRTHMPTLRYLHHCLAIADVHLSIRDTTATTASSTCEVQIEPAAWRRFTGLGGESQWLKPDMAATLSGHDTDGAYEDGWFIEVDCGTESIPTLLRKCEQYEAYLKTGIEQAASGVFPLVLWTFFGDRAEKRNEALRRSISRSSRFTSPLYRYATPDTLRAVLGGQE